MKSFSVYWTSGLCPANPWGNVAPGFPSALSSFDGEIVSTWSRWRLNPESGPLRFRHCLITDGWGEPARETTRGEFDEGRQIKYRTIRGLLSVRNLVGSSRPCPQWGIDPSLLKSNFSKRGCCSFCRCLLVVVNKKEMRVPVDKESLPFTVTHTFFVFLFCRSLTISKKYWWMENV